MTDLARVLILGLACYFTVSVVRALPPFKGWVERRFKPWACDLCMSFWSTAAWTAVLVFVCGHMFDPCMAAASGGACLALLHATNTEMPEPPPTFDFGPGKVNGARYDGAE